MNKYKMIILFISLCIVSIIATGVIYVSGYVDNILIPERCSIGKTYKFVVTADMTQNAVLIFTTNLELFGPQNNINGKLNIISSSGDQLSFHINKNTIKTGNWIYSKKTNNMYSKEYLICGDLIFSELLRKGEILLVSIEFDKSYEGEFWLFYLRKRKDKQDGIVKYIHLDK